MKNIFSIVFLLLTAILALSGSASAATGSSTQPLDHIVAVINDDVVVRSELDNYLENIRHQLRGQKTPLPPEDILEKQALDRLITQKVELQRAQETGIRVDDETLNRAILGIAAKNNMTLEQFRTALTAEGMRFDKFREDIRNEIIISHLQRRDVLNRIQVSNAEIKDFMLREKSQHLGGKLIKFSHILIALPDAASAEQIQKARDKAKKVYDLLKGGADFAQTAVAYSDGQKSMEGGDNDWMPVTQVPPLFAEALTQMKIGDISEPIRSPYGFHIVKLQDQRDESKHMIEQTHVRHILIHTTDLVPDENARNRLLQLKERIEGGDDFATLARANSDDTLSAKQGGDLGWLSQGDTVPQFEEAFNKLRIGQISEPVKTQYGWHIMQVLERREHDDTEQYLRNEAVKSIKQQKLEEELQAWLRRLRDEAYVENFLDRDRAAVE